MLYFRFVGRDLPTIVAAPLSRHGCAVELLEFGTLFHSGPVRLVAARKQG